MKKLKFIDLFSGVGGFHQALKDLDAECVFASEWDKNAVHTYFVNFGLTPYGDITKIDASCIPKHDILCGGFPCQPFSISGKQNGFSDTRGTLFFEILRIVKFHTPKILILENVKNFITHNSGDTLKTVVNSLDNAGYTVFHKILNASNFGLPQHRERLFIVAFRKDLMVSSFSFPIGSNIPVRLMDILETNPTSAKVVSRPDIVLNEEMVKNISSNCANKPIRIGILNKGGQGERIYSPYGHAITLSAFGGGVGAKTGLYYVNGWIRRLTPRECARVQGFPDSFNIVSSENQSYQQFGNSVAINVVRDVAKSAISIINSL